MKNIQFILTAVAMSIASLTAWADGTINIPQASAGEYILIGDASAEPKTTAPGVTLTGCQVDGKSATSYTVGSTNGNPFSIQLALTATAGNYLFSFKSGHAQGTAEVSLSLKNSENVEIWNNGGENVQISNTGAWALTEAHTFLLGDLAAGSYTLTLTGVSKSGSSYHGNFGNFCFHTAATLPMPYDLSHELNVSMATTSGLNISGTHLSNITANSYADDMYMYITDAGYYQVYAGYGYPTAGTDQFTITITDLATGIAEVNTKNYTVTSSMRYLMKDRITTGWKKIRLDHPNTPASGSFRLEHMYFIPVQDMPNSNENLLDVTQATVSGMKINGTYLTEITAGSYADDIYMEVPEDGYYQIFAEYGYNEAPGTDNFTITITDMNTDVAEVNAKNYILTDSKKYLMNDYITAGLKKIRLDHPGPISDSRYRLQKMYFILIQTMPDSPTNLLDITNATVSGMKINGTYLTEISVGSYADDIYVNFEQGGYFQVHAGYGWATSGTDNFTITISDVNTSTDEVDAQNFVVSTAQNYLMTDYVTPGLKKIRLDHPGPTITASFRLENMYFMACPVLPVYGTNHLDLSKGTFGRTASAKYNHDPQYESGNQNIGYNGDGGYAEYYVENPVNATYTFHIATKRYQVSSFTLTITDLASGTEEINQDFVVADNSDYADQVCSLNNPLTTGVKKIRIETHSASNSYAFNYNDVAFGVLPYTRTHKHMNLNTLCYPYQIDTYSGATFYTMLHKVMEGGVVTDIYLQEYVGALEAGTPYFYVPEEGSAELVCHYSGDRQETPRKVNGVQGAYADNTAVPGGAFVTYNNNLQMVTGGFVTLGEYRAYVDMNEVPVEGAVAHIQGRKMLKIRNADAPAVATDVEEVQRDKGQWTKVIENGVLYLKYNGTMYNVQGMRVK